MSIFPVLWEVSGSFSARVRWDLSYVLKKIPLSKPIQCTIPRMIHNVNYGLWMIIMCLCRFIIITNVLLMGDAVGDVGDPMGIWELSVLSTQFFSVLYAYICYKKIKSINFLKMGKSFLPNSTLRIFMLVSDPHTYILFFQCIECFFKKIVLLI